MQNQASFEQFIQLVSQDPQLQQKLKAATLLATTDLEAALRSIVELGKEFGYSFTICEVAERLNVIPATPEDPLSELPDWELEAVAGGQPPNTSPEKCTPPPTPTRGIPCSTQQCHPHTHGCGPWAGQTNFCNYG